MHLPEKERGFIFPICLDPASSGCVVYVRVLKEGFPELWACRGRGTCSALSAASGVACKEVGVAEMECFWSQVHCESKQSLHIFLSSYE